MLVDRSAYPREGGSYEVSADLFSAAVITEITARRIISWLPN